MLMKNSLYDKITILVNSCDRYDDLWIPFFTLFKKYWAPQGIRIVLNTESKEFVFDGLEIECVHPERPDDPYGKRMLHVLSQIATPYVIMLLDDFFMRKNADWGLIEKIVGWMENDKNIVYFNCDCTDTYCDHEADLYPGFKRIPNGCEYTLNMQAAVWRTKKLMSYWRSDLSPWDWEVYTNLTAARSRSDKFYCVTELRYGFCDYGYVRGVWGVYRGKWIKDDVVPLFEKESISVDYAKRGFYEPEPAYPSSGIRLRETLKTDRSPSELIDRCLGRRESIRYARFLKKNAALGLFHYPRDILYIRFSLLYEQKRFLIRKARKDRIDAVLGKGSPWRK